MVAVQAAANAVGDDEDRSGRAVVGAAAEVLGRASTELGEDRHGDLLRDAAPSEILLKGRERVADLREQLAVLGELADVRVEPAEREVNDLDADARVEQLCRPLEVRAELARRVVGRRGVANVRDLLGRGERLEPRLADDASRRRFLRIGRVHRANAIGGRRQSKLRGIVDRHGRGRGRGERERRLLLAERDRSQSAPLARLVEEAADPPRGSPFRIARLPDLGRAEVREVRVRIPDALHDRELSRIVEPLEAAERAVQRQPAVDRERVALGERERGPQPLVGRVRDRHDRVQSVVAARQVEHHERPRARRRARAERAPAHDRERRQREQPLDEITSLDCVGHA